MKYQAILFDFDYTLGDATASIYEGFCFAFDKLGYPRPELDAVKATVGHILEDEFTILTGNADPAAREEFRRIFREKTVPTQPEKTVICTGARELILAIRSTRARVGIVTSKNKTTLESILARHELLELMDFTIGGNLVKHPKPDPEGILTAISTLGVERERVLFCGDTVIDAAAAQNAGVEFAAVLNGITPGTAFADFPHVTVAEDLPALQRFLGL